MHSTEPQHSMITVCLAQFIQCVVHDFWFVFVLHSFLDLTVYKNNAHNLIKVEKVTQTEEGAM